MPIKGVIKMCVKCKTSNTNIDSFKQVCTFHGTSTFNNQIIYTITDIHGVVLCTLTISDTNHDRIYIMSELILLTA